MNAKITKAVSVILAILMIATLALSAVFSLVGNIFTRKIADNTEFHQEDYEAYSIGSYTSNIYVDEVNVSGKSLLTLITDFKYLRLIYGVQDREFSILLLKEEIEKHKKSIDEELERFYKIADPTEFDVSSHNSTIENYNEEIKECQEEISKYLLEIADLKADLTEDELKDLKEKKLNDKNFRNSIALLYMIFNGFGLNSSNTERSRGVSTGSVAEDITDTEEEIPGDNSSLQSIINNASDSHNTSTLLGVSVFSAIFPTIFLFVAIFVTLIIGVVLTINALVKIIKLLKNIKNADITIIDKLQTKPLLGMATTGFILLTYVKIFAGSAIEIGSAYIFIGVAFIVDCLACAFATLAECNFKIEKLVGIGITVLSSVLIIVLVFAVASTAMGAVINDKVEKFENESFLAIYEKHATELYNSANVDELGDEARTAKIADIQSEAYNLADKELESKSKLLYVPMAILLILAIAVVAGAASIIVRITGRKFKDKEGNESENGPMYGLGIFLIICAIALSFFTVNKLDKYEALYEKGTYKVLVNEYKIKDTYDRFMYEETEEIEDQYDDMIDEAEDMLEDLDGEDKQALKNKIKEMEGIEEQISNTKDELRETNINFVVIIVLSVLLIVTEIAYKILPAKLDKHLAKGVKEDGTPSEDSAPSEAPAEAEA